MLMVIQTPGEELRPSIRQRPLWKVPQLGLLVFAIAFLYWKACPLDPTKTPDRSLYNANPTIIDDMASCSSTDYDRCQSIVACETLWFGFNISDSDGHWRLFDSSNPTVDGRLSGTIIIEEGSRSQTSDVEVEYGLRSSSTTDHHNVVFNQSESSLSMNYLPPDDDGDVCTEILLRVSLRPESPRRLLDSLEIRSEMLMIWVWGFSWQINHFITRNSRGVTFYSAGKEAPEIRPRKWSASSTTGLITGAWVFDGTIEVGTESGHVGLLLVPQHVPRSPKGPSIRPDSLSVKSKSGDVELNMLWEYWTEQPFTHHTHVSTVSGKISADIPHGSLTNLSSISGDIDARLQPFAATGPHDASAIYTSTQSGRTVFYLDNTNREPLDELYDPLLSTASKHHVGDGEMKLRYPFSWFGSMDATVGEGSIKFGGSALDEVEEGEGFVKAVRGRGAGSRMEAHVNKGTMDVTLGIWDTDE